MNKLLSTILLFASLFIAIVYIAKKALGVLSFIPSLSIVPEQVYQAIGKHYEAVGETEGAQRVGELPYTEQANESIAKLSNAFGKLPVWKENSVRARFSAKEPWRYSREIGKVYGVSGADIQRALGW